MSDPTFLAVADLAVRLRVKPATVRTYLARGVLPPPDDRIGRSPRWRLSTIRRWEKGRPGQGARTDLSTGSYALRSVSWSAASDGTRVWPALLAGGAVGNFDVTMDGPHLRVARRP